jgi:anaphase-promoting complex subunit 6
MGQKQELFYLSHQLTTSKPQEATSWYCVGCYYWVISKMDLAQKFLKKAVKKNKDFSAAHVLLGHVFSALEENEQSLASFRSAVRYSPQSHIPMLCIGKELMRNGNYWLAAHTLHSAKQLYPKDLTVLNELGVVFAKLGKLEESLQYIQYAIDIMQNITDSSIPQHNALWTEKPDIFTSSITAEVTTHNITLQFTTVLLTFSIDFIQLCHYSTKNVSIR